MKVGVVGVGYVGLSTAVCLAAKFKTVAVDVNKARIRELSAGRVPIHERGLADLLKRGISTRRLAFSSSSNDLSDSDAIFIAVGTPGKQDGSIDLTQVRNSSADIGALVAKSRRRPLVLVRSTVIPGTARGVVKPILEESSGKRCGEGFLLCSNPEFLREGSAIQDTLSPQRIVLGGLNRPSLLAAKSLYRSFYGSRSPPFVATTPEGAEITKYASNSFLASKVSFINLISRLCERFPGTDVNDVARGMGLDPRIGELFLQAGPGFGGSCLPKDVRAFGRFLAELGMDPAILESVLKVNEVQPEHIVGLAEKRAGDLSGKEVAVLGLAFKAETDDIRESRSFPLIKLLLERGAAVRVYDPVAMPAAKRELSSLVSYSPSARDCIDGADVAIAMTAWRQIKGLKASDFSELMRSRILIDARRVYDPRAYSAALEYSAVGLGGEPA